MSNQSSGALRLAPTDISQFIRLEQCQRYLALRLQHNRDGDKFLDDYGVQPQSIPPILTRSGASFEQQVEDECRAHFTVTNLASELKPTRHRAPQNDTVIKFIQKLLPGATLILFQVRLEVETNNWLFRGDADIVRLTRTEGGELESLIADMKSSTIAKVEHRLQVAFYQLMLTTLLERSNISTGKITTGILYRGGTQTALELGEVAVAQQQLAAKTLFGLTDAYLELVGDPETYLEAVNDLVTGPDATARRIAKAPLAELPYHLSYKCDGCIYSEHCTKATAEEDDLSLLPHLTALDKEALRRSGVKTTRKLAYLKELEPASFNLKTTPGEEELVQRLAATWPVGPHLDELIHRARYYRRWKKDEIEALSFIPSKGHGSLPYADANHNPNLVRIFLDAQEDYLLGRIYMLGALVIGCEDGIPKSERRRSIVRLTDSPPATDREERTLFVSWLQQVLDAIVEVAAPDASDTRSAPLHLIFYDRLGQKVFLNGLARHLGALLEATPLYDFVTQLAAFDSPVATFLDEEIRELKNYPMLCQSLHSVAAYLGFNWREGTDYRRIFYTRLFDFWGKLDNPVEKDGWYTSRARFSSALPLEYAYAAWDELEPEHEAREDKFRPYRSATLPLLAGFEARRLEAIEHITATFKGNHLTEKRSFDLPDLVNFSDKAPGMARAMEEFVTIERHVELGEWKATRNLAPERRVLMGETLLVRYHEEDQPPEEAAKNQEYERKRLLREKYIQEFWEQNPDAAKLELTKEQKEATKWSIEGLKVKLKLEGAELLDFTTQLALTSLREGSPVILFPRITYDTRLPEAERTENTPTPKQMLYGTRGKIIKLDSTRDETGQVTAAWVKVELNESFGSDHTKPHVFPAVSQPLKAGLLYTLDPDPNSWNSYWAAVTTRTLARLGASTSAVYNSLYELITRPGEQTVLWPAAAASAQTRFMAGLSELNNQKKMHEFEKSKIDYIGSYGDAPVLLVQGPPGTGKSYSTGFALFARLQGAMAANQPLRIVISCKTHAAIDVLLTNIIAVQTTLKALAKDEPALFNAYFDPRLLDVPLYRLESGHEVPQGAIKLTQDRNKAKGEPKNGRFISSQSYCVLAATPGRIYNIVKEAAGKNGLLGEHLCECVVLDEASQMNLPEAVMATLPLKSDGQLIVVGDHRQMPPIIKHDWDAEPRRTFKEYKSYQSLFNTLLELNPPMIKFEESFRLHKVMAEFLGREIYALDNIAYHSRKTGVLPELNCPDEFTAAALKPAYPLVVIVHNEGASQTRNSYEQELIKPLLNLLADPAGYGLGAAEGLGVVVPHRAQRAELQKTLPLLQVSDENGVVSGSAVDTVERFQGGEREVIVVSATESDPAYLLTAGDFLFDPRRLTVAISRAKKKLIVVASKEIFSMFSPDEKAFVNSQLWKNLLRRTCTTKLWEGTQHGQKVEVWGSAATPLKSEV